MESKERLNVSETSDSCRPNFGDDDTTRMIVGQEQAARQRFAPRQFISILPALLCVLVGGLAILQASLTCEQSLPSRRLLADTSIDVSMQHATVSDDFHSTVHCVGENFGNDNWKYKSCQFRNLCFDTQSKDYVLFPSPEQVELEHLLGQRQDKFVSLSSVMRDSSVSLGTLNPDWEGQQLSLRWFPRIETDRTQLHAQGVTMYPQSVLMVPFHSYRATHPGHFLWDDLFPIFLLMSMFGLKDKHLTLHRHVLGSPLHGTCDSSADNLQACETNFAHYETLVGADVPNTLVIDSNQIPGLTSHTRYLCSRFGAAGLGMVSNHVLKQSDWTADDYKLTHMVGFGSLVWQFRMFMVNKLALKEVTLPSTVSSSPLVVTFAFSASSSELAAAVEPVRQRFSSSSVQVESHAFDKLNVEEQALIVSRTAVLVTDCTGHGLAMAGFLPRQSSLLLHCPSSLEGVALPAKLEWDLLNHAGYFSTHWLGDDDDLAATLSSTIQADVSRLRQQAAS